MTDTTVSAAVRAKQWDTDFFKEYVRESRFKRYMGKDENSIIQVKNDLTKKQGDAITIALVGALDSTTGPNDGTTTLVGNEKALPNDGHKISVSLVRDATVINVTEEQASAIAIRDAGKVALKTLSMRYLRNAIINALGSVQGTAYAAATVAQQNSWNIANADRVLYGTSTTNRVAGDHAASLTNIAATEKLDRATVSMLKRMAQSAKNANGDGIRPITYGEDEETFVLFVGTRAYRDLKTNLESVHTNAREREKTNPLFTGTTSLYWDGVVIREIPEIGILTAVGTDPDGAGALPKGDVEPIYLCGAQALGVVWAMPTKTTLRKEDDYGFKYGVGFMELRGVDKILYGQGTAAAKDWGVVSGFVASVPDA